MAKKTKWIVFQPAAAIAFGATNAEGWMEQRVTFKGRLKSIRGTVVDPATQASAQNELEKVVACKYKIREEDRTSDIFLPIDHVAGRKGFPVVLDEQVGNQDTIRVTFQNQATAGASLMPTLVFELEIDDPAA